MEWIKKNRSMVLLCASACLGIFLGVLWYEMPLVAFLFSFFFLWLSYYLFKDGMKKMLLRDVVLLLFTQVGVWSTWYALVNAGKTDEIGASIGMMMNILVFLLDGFFITGMMTGFYIRESQKIPACITGGITLIGGVFFVGLAVVLFL